MFVQVAEPIDEANFRIVIKGSEAKWEGPEGNRPRIYQFLRDFVRDGLNRGHKLEEDNVHIPLGFNKLAFKTK